MSGCNIWSKQIIACAQNQFAFASTLAIHVYDIRNFQLIKLLSAADANITAIAWQPIHEKYLALASYLKQFSIWNLETETIKFQVQLPHRVVYIEWSSINVNEIFLLLSSSKFFSSNHSDEVKRIDLSSQKVHDLIINFGPSCLPKVIKVNPRIENLLAIGLNTGSVIFFDSLTMKMFMLPGPRVYTEDEEETKDD